MSTHRFTTAEYYQLGDLGLLEHTELIEGIITDMEPIGPFHADIGDILCELFVQQAQGRYKVRVQYPIALGSQSLPQPDLALCRPRRYRDRHPGPTDIYLVIEISDTSLDVDLGQKLALYKAAGIPEYWVIDLVTKCVHCFRGPDYMHQKLLNSISPLSWPDIRIDLEELL